MATPSKALQCAVQSLMEGACDPSSIEGAKVNALESMAWSLIGILAGKVDDPALEDLTNALGSYGFVTVPGTWAGNIERPAKGTGLPGFEPGFSASKAERISTTL